MGVKGFDSGQARKFFVGGNFKMNGSLAGIKAIVSTLNEAQLNPEVGKFPIPVCYGSPFTNTSQRLLSLLQPSTFPTPARFSARTLASRPRTSSTRAMVPSPVRFRSSRSRMLAPTGLSSDTLSAGRSSRRPTSLLPRRPRLLLTVA